MVDLLPWYIPKAQTLNRLVIIRKINMSIVKFSMWTVVGISRANIVNTPKQLWDNKKKIKRKTQK